MLTIREAEEILKEEYHIENFTYIINDILLPDFVPDKHEVQFNNSIFNKVTLLGTSKKCEVNVYEVILNEGTQNRRVTITQEMFRILRGQGINNALVAFSNADRQNYRLSLLTSKYEFNGEKVVKVLSNPRRYSYALGFGTKTKTAYQFLIGKGKVNNLDELIDRFSVEVVNKQFYNEIALSFTKLVGGERESRHYEKELNLNGVTSHNKYVEFAVRLIGRIIFCWFLKEKKSVNGIPLVPDSILSLNGIRNSNNYYHDVLEPLFFELLNTNQRRRKGKFATEEIYNQIPYLNGGLFSPHHDDQYKFSPSTQTGQYGQVTIPNEWFNDFYKILNEYNFTVDENTAYDIELSIDPEMLGRIFENLLAEINPETGENAKKSTGSFYTPRDIVDYMADNSILEYLETKTEINEVKLKALISYSKDDDHLAVFDNQEKKKIINALYTFTILDPACGSGAFPIGMLQKIVYILQEIDPEANLWFDKATENVSILLKKEFEKKFSNGSLNYIRKLSVIQNSIFGVDIQPIAVEIARLRCFLSLVIEETVYDDEENRGINPLPSLDFKFIVANSLIKLNEGNQLSLFENQDHIMQLKAIREEYFNADSERKVELREEFNDIQKQMLQTTIEQFAKQPSKRYELLYSWSPFKNEPTDWFDPEWMFGIKDGFDIVIGNPPYIQLQKDSGKLASLYEGQGFKSFAKTGDIYCLFYEKGCNLLNSNGRLCFITSNKWMRAGYGEKLRAFFANNVNPKILVDFAGVKVFESATVDTNILLFEKGKNEGKTQSCTTTTLTKYGLSNLGYFVQQNSCETNFGASESWVILSPIEQRIKRKIEKVGTPLKEWDINIYRGVLTGFNDAFIISGEKRQEILNNCKSKEERVRTADLIRPILRGRDIKRYSYNWVDLWLIYIPWHFPLQFDKTIQGASKKAEMEFKNQYPAVYTHLLQYKKELSARNKSETGIRYEWYALQRWGANYWDEFDKPKICWARLMRLSKSDLNAFPRFCFIPKDFYVVDSLCFFTGTDIGLLIKELNSEFAAYYFFNSVATLDNGGFQMRQQYVEEIPLPKLSKLNANTDIDKEIYKAFNFTDEEIKFIKTSISNKKKEIESLIK